MRQEYGRARHPGDASGMKQIKKDLYWRHVGEDAVVNGAGTAMPDPHYAVDYRGENERHVPSLQDLGHVGGDEAAVDNDKSSGDGACGRGRPVPDFPA